MGGSRNEFRDERVAEETAMEKTVTELAQALDDARAAVTRAQDELAQAKADEKAAAKALVQAVRAAGRKAKP
jgi:hypothetical protein